MSDQPVEVSILGWETAIERLNAALELAESRLVDTYRYRADISISSDLSISYMKSGNRWGIYTDNGAKTMMACSVGQRIEIANNLHALEAQLRTEWHQAFEHIEAAIDVARAFAENNA